ncbi:MAG TPA: Hsp70 family protein, partial [Trichormus sp.]
REISRMVLAECERLKESLSFRERAEFTVINPTSGSVIDVEMARGEFEDLLDKKGAFTQINKTIRRALKAAGEKGFNEDQIKSVLMVGGCSLIPSVQKELKRLFGNDKVLLKRPLDAVARGAAAFIAGTGFKDYIQHDYAIRYVNPATGTYEYRPLVRRGTPYPSTSVLAEITVKGSFNGQAQLGLPIFELGGTSSSPHEDRLEVFFDEHGIPMVHAVGTAEYKRRNMLWINESNPTFLRADPPCKRSEPRFRIEFMVDGNRRLLMTAHDLNSADVVFKDYPVAKLI